MKKYSSISTKTAQTTDATKVIKFSLKNEVDFQSFFEKCNYDKKRIALIDYDFTETHLTLFLDDSLRGSFNIEYELIIDIPIDYVNDYIHDNFEDIIKDPEDSLSNWLLFYAHHWELDGVVNYFFAFSTALLIKSFKLNKKAA